jgi:hypothetical protein
MHKATIDRKVKGIRGRSSIMLSSEGEEDVGKSIIFEVWVVF